MICRRFVKKSDKHVEIIKEHLLFNNYCNIKQEFYFEVQILTLPRKVIPANKSGLE